MPTETPYSIADLARLTGVNVRTIRYYLAQGLLPGSGESGPGAHYGEGHLDRLRLTRQLQEQHQPLAEIRRRLAEMTDADVAGVLATAVEPNQMPTTSALDYVRAILGKQPTAIPSAPSTAAPAPTSAPAPTLAPAPSPSRAPAHLLRNAGYALVGMDTEARETPAATGAAPGAPSGPPQTAGYVAIGMVSDAGETQPSGLPTAAGATASARAPGAGELPTTERSQWERLSLVPNVELHIRRPLSRLEQRRVERLITIARQVLKEE